ncbi:MAG: tRNA (adenosine(37)-N6)-dimethylallyltransferase MiaA [Cyanobacteria bacterium J06633_2]
MTSHSSLPHSTHSPNLDTPVLIVICGPTATGKSGLAMAIAQRLNGVILSADSRQVYREFDIGTAKPSPDDLAAVPHYLIDICEPTETLTLADFQSRAQTLIAQCHQSSFEPTHHSASALAGTVPLLVGGTGLYIKSVVRGLLIPRVPPHHELRSHLESLGQPHCYALLQQVDPASASRFHPNDQVRTLRALEVFYVTGIPITQQQGEVPPRYPVLSIGLDCTAIEKGEHRIKKRTHQMIENGFVEEVAQLQKKYGADLPLLKTLGYQEVGQYVQGTISLSEAIAQTILHTRQFAKRQRTWFRADSSIEWFDADHPHLVEQIWDRIQSFMTEPISR